MKEVWTPDPRLTEEAEGPPSIRMAMDILDGNQAELLMSRLCNGGEEIQIGISRSRVQPDVLRVVYRVPNVLQMFREAYVQDDGQVILAEGIRGLYWRDQDTRGWVHLIDDENFLRALQTSSVRIDATLDTTLTAGERKRQRYRDAILFEQKWGSPPDGDYEPLNYDVLRGDSEDGEHDGDDSKAIITGHHTDFSDGIPRNRYGVTRIDEGR
jgi:hypothetical protein